jgi:site-specific recombinase XerD
MEKNRNRRWETMDKSGTDLSTLIRHFEVHNRTEGKSLRTVGWYNEVLGLLHRWLQEEGLSTALGSMDEMVIREFIIYLQGRPGCKGESMSSHSIYNRVNALRSFFGWLYARGYTEEHVLRDLKQPKTADLIIEPLTQEEIEKVFSAMNPNSALGARNSAIVSLMLDTGVRLSEATGLKEQDVHIEGQYVKVMGKGSKERMVSFGASCQKTLLHYFYHFRPGPAHEGVDAFFLAIDGYPLTAESVRSLVKRLARSSGVRRLHPHLLRHTYATMFLLNGGDVFLLKQNLGHTTLSMVEHYLHVATQTAAIRSQGFSPLDRLNIRESRRYRHSSGWTDMRGSIYPNVGRASGRRRLVKKGGRGGGSNSGTKVG